jgi:hypothetical protein
MNKLSDRKKTAFLPQKLCRAYFGLVLLNRLWRILCLCLLASGFGCQSLMGRLL